MTRDELGRDADDIGKERWVTSGQARVFADALAELYAAFRAPVARRVIDPAAHDALKAQLAEAKNEAATWRREYQLVTAAEGEGFTTMKCVKCWRQTPMAGSASCSACVQPTAVAPINTVDFRGIQDPVTPPKPAPEQCNARRAYDQCEKEAGHRGDHVVQRARAGYWQDSDTGAKPQEPEPTDKRRVPEPEHPDNVLVDGLLNGVTTKQWTCMYCHARVVGGIYHDCKSGKCTCAGTMAEASRCPAHGSGPAKDDPIWGKSLAQELIDAGMLRLTKERDDAAYAGSIALSEAQTLTKELDATRAMHRETVKRLTEQRDDARARIAVLKAALTDVARLWPAGVSQRIAREALGKKP